MIQRMVTSGVFAGFAVGVLAAILHFGFVQQPLLLGEAYETGAVVHFADSGSDGHAVAGHGHGDNEHGDGQGAHDDTGEQGDLQRNALTVLFTALVYVAYGLFLTAAYQVAEALGKPVTARQGVMWGLAGFAAFQLAPAMGLPPELPGTIAADLQLRQVWWLSTVLATAVGLAIMAYGQNLVSAAVGAVFLAAPHIIGAPHPDNFWGVAPPELGAQFASRTLGVGFVVWAALGWLTARLWAAGAER